MQIIDFERKGNVIRFYLGDDDAKYYGDDWDDSPYQHNAGPVYDRFIKGYVDLSVPFSYDVVEPADKSERYSKDDMVNRIVPCITIVAFDSSMGLSKPINIFFGDDPDVVAVAKTLLSIDQKLVDNNETKVVL